MVTFIIFLIISPLVDLLIFLNITRVKARNTKDKFILVGVLIAILLLEIISDFTLWKHADLLFTLIEISLFGIVFYKRIKSKMLFINSGLMVAILGVINDLIGTVSDNLWTADQSDVVCLLISIIEYLIIRYYSSKLNKIFSGINKKLFFIA